MKPIVHPAAEAPPGTEGSQTGSRSHHREVSNPEAVTSPSETQEKENSESCWWPIVGGLV